MDAVEQLAAQVEAAADLASDPEVAAALSQLRAADLAARRLRARRQADELRHEREREVVAARIEEVVARESAAWPRAERALAEPELRQLLTADSASLDDPARVAELVAEARQGAQQELLRRIAEVAEREEVAADEAALQQRVADYYRFVAAEVAAEARLQSWRQQRIEQVVADVACELGYWASGAVLDAARQHLAQVSTAELQSHLRSSTHARRAAARALGWPEPPLPAGPLRLDVPLPVWPGG